MAERPKSFAGQELIEQVQLTNRELIDVAKEDF
jgi:hypothetical protein